MKSFATFLTEAKAPGVNHQPDQLFSVYKRGKYASFPQYIVDMRDISDGTYQVYITKPRVLEAATKSRGWNTEEYGMFRRVFEQAVLSNFTVRENFFDELEHLIKMYDGGKIVRMSAEKIYKEFATKLNIPEYLLQRAFGNVEMSSAIGSGDEQVEFTSDIGPRHKKAIQQSIEAARAFADSFPMVAKWFDNTKFYVINTSIPEAPHAAGAYVRETQDRIIDRIVISAKQIKTPTHMVSTILHELIHRIVFLSKMEKAIFQGKRAPLYQISSRQTVDRAVLQTIARLATSGSKVEMNFDNRRYTIMGLDHSLRKIVFKDPKKPGTIYSVDPMMLLDYRRDVELIVDGNLWDGFSEDIKTLSKLFPSTYSHDDPNPEEWFCEIGAASMMRKLDGDIAKWFADEIEKAKDPPQ